MLNNLKLRTVTIVLLLLFLLSIVSNAIVNIISLRGLTADLLAIAKSNGVHATVSGMVGDHYTLTLVAIVLTTVFALVIAVLLFLIITKSFLAPLSELAVHFNAIAKGDLTQRVQDKGSNEIGQAFQSLAQMQGRLASTFSQVQQNVVQIGNESDDIASGNSEISARIDEQAAALQQTAASMEQLSGTVRQNADNAHQANQLATTASTVAQRGGEVVGEVVNTMQEISTSSSKIAEIVGVIDSIAFQTNILALNAAVEAARAGEQGRGFAVVASEVRSLAQRSAQAAREITDLIEDSGQKVKEGSGQVERAGATMHEIVDSVKRVTDIMGEISAATIEQSSGLDQINLAVNQLDATTLQNAEMITKSAQAAADMNEQVRRLNEILSGFETDSSVIDGTARRVSRPARQAPAKPQVAAGAARAVGTRHATAAPRQALGSSQPRKPVVKTTSSSPTVASRKKAADTPGMNVTSSGGKNAPLLRPDLSSKKPTSAVEDDWVEF